MCGNSRQKRISISIIIIGLVECRPSEGPVCHSEAEMVVKMCVTLQDIVTDEIMSDYLRITQTFFYQTL